MKREESGIGKERWSGMSAVALYVGAVTVRLLVPTTMFLLLLFYVPYTYVCKCKNNNSLIETIKCRLQQMIVCHFKTECMDSVHSLMCSFYFLYITWMIVDCIMTFSDQRRKTILKQRNRMQHCNSLISFAIFHDCLKENSKVIQLLAQPYLLCHCI